MSSVHEKIDRVRKPRVHIKYEVETEDGVVQKELPFVVGVVGDLIGDSPKAMKPLKDRKFTQIDRDNFNEVMANISPGLDLRVENTLANDGTDLAIQLAFNSLEDFEPVNIIQQVKPLQDLLDARNKLSLLASKADRSDELEGLLEDILQDTDALKKLANELGVDGHTKIATH